LKERNKMAKIAGFGIKVETDTGHFVWLTETGTTTVASRAMKFDSEMGAEMYRSRLAKNNPHANLIVKKFSK
jgi:hypothetical protein